MEYFQRNELHIVCILDGRPGHEKQTYGIVRALKKKVPVKVTKIEVNKPSLRSFLAELSGFYLPFGDMRGLKIVNPDIIISTGSSTHLTALFYKKKYRVPAVTCMAPDRLYRSRFDLCFVPVHDGYQQKGNILTTVGPPNCSTDRGLHDKNCGLVLVGGVDEKSHRWDNGDIAGKIENIVEHYPEIEWVLASSPRTPNGMILLLEKMSSLHSRVSFVNYKDTKPGWVEDQYDNSAIVWVTADSVSMMFEALTAGCKVGVIPVHWKKKINKFKTSVSFLIDNGFVLPYDCAVYKEEKWTKGENLNEAQKCADTILSLWWQKNL